MLIEFTLQQESTLDRFMLTLKNQHKSSSFITSLC